MFGRIEKSKTRYSSGQIFPFLIAILCAVLIMIMITVNLGQIGVFKTEVSNAADAGALAAASVLSSALLALGLRSESMIGYAQATYLAMLIAIAAAGWAWGLGVVIAILIYIAYILKMMIELQQAMGDSRLAWTNAKKSALQYAFSNAGSDDRRPTFEEFLVKLHLGSIYSARLPVNDCNRDASGNCLDGFFNPKKISAEDARYFHSIYYRGFDPEHPDFDLRPYTQSGFSRFMQDSEKGYWRFGKIRPRTSSRVVLTSGYGWNVTDMSNSYDDCDINQIEQCYKNYDNWIEVKVIGAAIYGVDVFSYFGGENNFFTCIKDKLMGAISIPWFLEWMVDPIGWMIEMMASFFQSKYLFPMGIELGDGSAQSYNNQVNNNYLVVKVTRNKGNRDVGLWEFKYNDQAGITATATSHAFQEHPGSRDSNCESETIRPVVFSKLFGDCLQSDCEATNKAHLFETELVNTF